MLLAAGCLAACQPLPGPGGPRGLTGSWGGQHIGLVLHSDGGTLDYDCASGSITGPLVVDRIGRFAGYGVHSPGHGGPDRVDVQPVRLAARYSGTVAGDRMSLRVDVEGGLVLGPFSLRRGAEPVILRCL
jgi:hypothetical protein